MWFCSQALASRFLKYQDTYCLPQFADVAVQHWNVFKSPRCNLQSQSNYWEFLMVSSVKRSLQVWVVEFPLKKYIESFYWLLWYLTQWYNDAQKACWPSWHWGNLAVFSRWQWQRVLRSHQLSLVQLQNTGRKLKVKSWRRVQSC